MDNYNYGRYEEWLDANLDEDDYEDVYCLYQAVYNIDSYGMYSAKMKGDSIVINADMGEEPLVLRDETDRQKFLDYLDDTYGEDIGVEALYSFNRAMEKDD